MVERSATSNKEWTRRGFIAGVGSTIAGAGLTTTALPAGAETIATDGSEFTGRRADLVQRRNDATAFHLGRPEPVLATNGDEERYGGGIASFTKTLPHNDLGEVDPAAFSAMTAAISSGRKADFDRIPDGLGAKLANPRAAHCFSMSGGDAHLIDMPAIHSLRSARQASEAAEVYWMAACRDVNFADFNGHPTTNRAIDDLNRYSDFTAPRSNGRIDSSTLFRGQTPGDLTGPYVSQFLLADIGYGNRTNRQTAMTPRPYEDFMGDYESWLHIQNGGAPQGKVRFLGPERYIRTPRELGEYVHRDYSYQAYLNAALICSGYGPAAVDTNPYTDSRREGAFLTFGGADHLDLVARGAAVGLRPAWFHKWLVHRKIRPEGFGGRVHNHLVGAASYDLHPEFLESPVLDHQFRINGTYLLSQAYPEGSPTHPSYPAGHATIAGACVTVLKAIFDEDFEIPRAVVPSRDGSWLEDYRGPGLTLGGELNKLASNIALARNHAGVHWRADGDDGLVVGEEAALSLLQDHLREVIEDDGAYMLTKFSGERVLVTADAISSV